MFTGCSIFLVVKVFKSIGLWEVSKPTVSISFCGSLTKSSYAIQPSVTGMELIIYLSIDDLKSFILSTSTLSLPIKLFLLLSI